MFVMVASLLNEVVAAAHDQHDGGVDTVEQTCIGGGGYRGDGLRHQGAIGCADGASGQMQIQMIDQG
jgi:hypothetical protein